MGRMFTVPSIRDYPSFAGVYKFTNKTNGKVYIGETKHMRNRMSKYRHKRKTGEIHLISRAFHKYGFENFKYDVLESFPLGTPKSTLLDREEFWIRIYNALDKEIGYNILPRGVDQTGRKMSQHTKDCLRKANLGRKHTEETRRQMSQSRMGEKNWNFGRKGPLCVSYGRKMTEEHKKILAVFNCAPKPFLYKKVNQLDLKSGEIIKTWDSIGDAAEGVRGDRTKYHGISHTLNGGQNQAFGFGWSYADKPEI